MFHVLPMLIKEKAPPWLIALDLLMVGVVLAPMSAWPAIAGAGKDVLLAVVGRVTANGPNKQG